MAVAGGKIWRSRSSTPGSEVELDSAESALLFGCHLQARGARLLDDGEVFYVPKDVRIGPRGASARPGLGTSTSSSVRPPARASRAGAYGSCAADLDVGGIAPGLQQRPRN